MKTLLTAEFVIGFDGEDHVIIENGQVVYEDDTIIYVGKNYQGDYDDKIDAGRSVISPGFIDLNALGDIDHDILHIEAGEKGKNLMWSEDYFDEGPRRFMNQSEEAFKSLYAYTQLILNGVTTAMPITSVLYKKWAETYEELVAAVHNAGNLGLRMYMGPSYQSGMKVVDQDGKIKVRWKKEKGQAGLEQAVRFIKEFDGAYDNLIRGMLAPERIETQTTENLVNTKKYSEELNCPIRLHAAQSAFDYNEIQNRHGKTPISYLNEIGFLGENVSIPHAHFVDSYSQIDSESDQDLSILSETGTTVIHCPLIINRHCSPLESFAGYEKRGINMATGTDTFPPDFFQVIRNASIVSRIVEHNVEGSRFADIFRAATIGGADYLNRDDLGRLCPGAKADIIIIDLEGIHMGSVEDPIRTMFMSGSGRDVKTSIINGEIVMKDRQIDGINIDSLKEKERKYFKKLKNSYVERDYQKLGADKLYDPSFRKLDDTEL